MGTVHIVGAGLAGLSAALRIARAGAGLRVVLYESAGHAGGRCRSFHDAALGCEIDNGNHLILGANPAVLAYLEAIGSRGGLSGPDEAAFPFVDLRTREHWTLRPNAGRLPWWILARARRVPGTRTLDYLAVRRLLAAPADAAVTDCLDRRSTLFRRLWEPLTVAALNAAPAEASARLLARVVRDTFGAGGAACRPYIAADGLTPVLVDPALRALSRDGAAVHFNARLRALETSPERGVESLLFAGETVETGSEDIVTLAVPPVVLTRILPEVPVPEGSRAILNLHYRLPRAIRFAGARVGLVGLVGATAQWLFLRGEILSVTVSAADALMDEPEAELLPQVWREIRAALALMGQAGDVPEAPPPGRVVKEKRATFLQSPANLARRPGPATGLANLFLAGDWTDTGLPATIEGAIRSGEAAAGAALAKPETMVHKRAAFDSTSLSRSLQAARK
jgi:squalene-associated FAD-dependent desaturase